MIISCKKKSLERIPMSLIEYKKEKRENSGKSHRLTSLGALGGSPRHDPTGDSFLTPIVILPFI